MDDITHVGLDVHKVTFCLAVAEGGRGGEVRQIGVFDNRPDILCKLAARLGKSGRRLSFCYKAGPCGYGLQRLLTSRGHSCIVVAPSLIPMKSDDRVKTESPRCGNAGQAAPGRRANRDMDPRCRARSNAGSGAGARDGRPGGCQSATAIRILPGSAIGEHYVLYVRIGYCLADRLCPRPVISKAH
jgi:hypothetical protein